MFVRERVRERLVLTIITIRAEILNDIRQQLYITLRYSFILLIVSIRI